MPKNYYNKIKEQFINNEVYKKVKDYSKNKNELETYYNVGKLIIEAQGGEEKSKYGNKLIKEYSKQLTSELGKGYGWRNLYNMRQFYLLIEKSQEMTNLSSYEFLQALPAKLGWSQICELLPLKDKNEINYYIKIASEQNLPYRKLREKIKSNEYGRLSIKTKQKLINNEKKEIQDFIKHPIIIKGNYNKEEISEKILKELILENLDDFLEELGDGFTYIKSEYKIKSENIYNYIDLLLFNYIYNCFVVLELKITKLKHEHIGQIKHYMNYIDENIKTLNQNKTIGIIICKEDNKFVVKYSSDPRIFRTTYELV